MDQGPAIYTQAMSSPGKNPEQSESELRELRMLLMTYWDPIGVNGIPGAADEYDSYLGGLAEKLREGADAHGVSEYLSEIQTERMEIPTTPDQLTDEGEWVAVWYAAEMKR